MARKPHIHVPGGFYHVILRGNSRQDMSISERELQSMSRARNLAAIRAKTP